MFITGCSATHQSINVQRGVLWPKAIAHREPRSRQIAPSDGAAEGQLQRCKERHSTVHSSGKSKHADSDEPSHGPTGGGTCYALHSRPRASDYRKGVRATTCCSARGARSRRSRGNHCPRGTRAGASSLPVRQDTEDGRTIEPGRMQLGQKKKCRSNGLDSNLAASA